MDRPQTSPAHTPTRLDRAVGICMGLFLGAMVGLFFGICLACFGLTMWLWLIIPLVGATLGGAIGIRFPASISRSSKASA